MKVLLVDDSPVAREVTARHLARMGHPVVQAADGPSALECYVADAPDLVLLDVEMPGISGYAVARAMRERDNDGRWIPIIFLSGRVRDEDIALGIEAGGDDYITKPVSSVVLRAKINAMHRITEMQQRLIDTSRDLQRANAELFALSSSDGLTGIANRRAFDQAFANEWQRAERGGTSLAVIIGDVDYFKRYNDTYGHQSGDACLCTVAQALAGAGRRAGEVVARFGGEEFVVLLPDTDVSGAAAIAGRLLDAVRELRIPNTSSDVADYVTMSFGFAALVPAAGSSPDDLIAAADAALYRAKDGGRDRCAP